METKREDIRQAGTEYLKGDLFGWQNFSACYRIFEAGVLWSEGRLSTREKNSKAQEESLRIERLECDQRGLKLASLEQELAEERKTGEALRTNCIELEQENKELKEGHAGMLRERNDMYEDREAKNIECLNLTKQLAEQVQAIERLKERVRAAMDERNVVRREVITQHGEIERLKSLLVEKVMQKESSKEGWGSVGDVLCEEIERFKQFRQEDATLLLSERENVRVLREALERLRFEIVDYDYEDGAKAKEIIEAALSTLSEDKPTQP